MNKIIVFDTRTEIEKNLKPHFSHNQEYSRLQCLHKGRNASATSNDSFQFTYLIGLFASDDGQFWYSGGIQDLSECEGDQESSTIEALAQGVKGGISDASKNYRGAWIVPLFYTIKMPINYRKKRGSALMKALKFFKKFITFRCFSSGARKQSSFSGEYLRYWIIRIGTKRI